MPTEALPWYETVLIYAGIPLLLFLLLAAWTLLPHRNRDKTVYRPGQPWQHEAIWYEPHPDAAGVHGAGSPAVAGGHGELEEHPGAVAAALALGERPHEAEPAGPRRTAAGGARGTW
ncbi:hypothetical protein [Modestobacter sp. NPDC049651]|uniref:aa3-type cytochrome oxidase subunit CtaJ n=1 Tax=unclassified Modestobacter TaxID=2643866 RepID=UPI00340F444E